MTTGAGDPPMGDAPQGDVLAGDVPAGDGGPGDRDRSGPQDDGSDRDRAGAPGSAQGGPWHGAVGPRGGPPEANGDGGNSDRGADHGGDDHGGDDHGGDDHGGDDPRGDHQGTGGHGGLGPAGAGDQTGAPFARPGWISHSRVFAAALSACDHVAALADLPDDAPAARAVSHLRDLDALARRFVLRLDDALAVAGQPRMADDHRPAALEPAARIRRHAAEILTALRVEALERSGDAPALHARLTLIANRASRIASDLERLEDHLIHRAHPASEPLDGDD